MQQSNQEIYSYPRDEFDLKKILNSLVARKLLIFGLTAFVTLIAIIVVFNIPPIYKAVSSFTSPSDSSLNNLNKLQLTSNSIESVSNELVFTNFLTLLSSKEFQTKIFIDGDYLTAFNPKNNPIDDVNTFVSDTIVFICLT